MCPICPACQVETELTAVVADVWYYYWCEFCDYEKIILREA